VRGTYETIVHVFLGGSGRHIRESSAGHARHFIAHGEEFVEELLYGQRLSEDGLHLKFGWQPREKLRLVECESSLVRTPGLSGEEPADCSVPRPFQDKINRSGVNKLCPPGPEWEAQAQPI